MEEKVVYEHGWSDRYIGLKDLVRGRVYFTMEKQIMMYLGIAKSGKHLFYQFAVAITKIEIERRAPQGTVPSYRDQYNIITFANYDAQVAGIRRIMELSMASRADRDCVVGYKKNPGIIGEFPCCHYEDSYLTWYKESLSGDPKAPVILEGQMKTDYVSAKDLVPGRCYYTGHGSVYCFLGRSSEGYFVWHYICWSSQFTERLNDAEYLCSQAEVTKSNKRCKPLELLPEDEDAYTYDNNTLKIIEENLKVDPRILDQGLIEQTVRRHTERGY